MAERQQWQRPKAVDLAGEENDGWLRELPAGKEEQKIHEGLERQFREEEKGKKGNG